MRQHHNSKHQEPSSKWRLTICWIYLLFPVLFVSRTHWLHFFVQDHDLTTYFRAFAGGLCFMLWIELPDLLHQLFSKDKLALSIGCVMAAVFFLPLLMMLFLLALFVPWMIFVVLPIIVLPWVGLIGFMRSNNGVLIYIGFTLFFAYFFWLLLFVMSLWDFEKALENFENF